LRYAGVEWDKSLVKLDKYTKICKITSKLGGDNVNATNAIVDHAINIRGNSAAVETLKL
jgi:hypothetical protein